MLCFDFATTKRVCDANNLFSYHESMNTAHARAWKTYICYVDHHHHPFRIKGSICICVSLEVIVCALLCAIQYRSRLNVFHEFGTLYKYCIIFYRNSLLLNCNVRKYTRSSKLHINAIINLEMKRHGGYAPKQNTSNHKGKAQYQLIRIWSPNWIN